MKYQRSLHGHSRHTTAGAISISRMLLRYFGRYPAMGATPLPLECHGRTHHWKLGGALDKADWKDCMDGLERISDDNEFQSITVRGKNEYLYVLV